MGTSDSRCPRCGSAVPDEARFCPACGYATTRLAPGQILDGKYEILDKFGEGGMGQVYRARHVHLDEIRIIKVTKPDALGEGGEARRFQEEARLATLVRHPNVAALYDFSRLPDGSYYMVWEFIDGETLEQRLRRGPMPAAQVLEVAGQVLSGLSEIHAQGIVHRDISPDNIMLRSSPDGRTLAKLIDLGIAKRVTAESLRMTGTGLFLGKLKYCSPEQAGGLPRGESVDGRSDLYSFGVVLYEMLAGRPPFEAETPEAYLGKHLHAAAPPLDTSTLPAATGASLASILKRALEKDRARRYQTAEEFRTALGGIDPGVRRPPTTTLTRLLPLERRGAWSVGVLALVLVLAAGVAVYATVHRREQRPPPLPVSASRPTPFPTELPVPTDSAEISAPRVVETSGDVRSSSRGVENPSESAPARLEPSRRRDAPLAAPSPPPVPSPETAVRGAESDLPGMTDPDSPQRFRRFLAHWRTLGLDRQARRAHDLARWANQFVDKYPDDPLSGELKTTLPASLEDLALRSLDERRPLLATLLYRARRELAFAPENPVFEARFRQRRPARDSRGPE